VEFHPFLDQSALLRFAEGRKPHLFAYAPLARGRLAGEAKNLEIARRHGRTPAQVTLRWIVQHARVAAIPKAARREHLEENLRIFDFTLDEDEMRALSGLGRNQRLVDPTFAPNWNAG
jgi:2,5-diketo-D-gluconate reductase B